jgi:hypothetical protein
MASPAAQNLDNAEIISLDDEESTMVTLLSREGTPFQVSTAHLRLLQTPWAAYSSDPNESVPQLNVGATVIAEVVRCIAVHWDQLVPMMERYADDHRALAYLFAQKGVLCTCIEPEDGTSDLPCIACRKSQDVSQILELLRALSYLGADFLMALFASQIREIVNEQLIKWMQSSDEYLAFIKADGERLLLELERAEAAVRTWHVTKRITPAHVDLMHKTESLSCAISRESEFSVISRQYTRAELRDKYYWGLVRDNEGSGSFRLSPEVFDDRWERHYAGAFEHLWSRYEKLTSGIAKLGMSPPEFTALTRSSLKLAIVIELRPLEKHLETCKATLEFEAGTTKMPIVECRQLQDWLGFTKLLSNDGDAGAPDSLSFISAGVIYERPSHEVAKNPKRFDCIPGILQSTTGADRNLIAEVFSQYTMNRDLLASFIECCVLQGFAITGKSRERLVDVVEEPYRSTILGLVAAHARKLDLDDAMNRLLEQRKSNPVKYGRMAFEKIHYSYQRLLLEHAPIQVARAVGIPEEHHGALLRLRSNLQKFEVWLNGGADKDLLPREVAPSVKSPPPAESEVEIRKRLLERRQQQLAAEAEKRKLLKLKEAQKQPKQVGKKA